MRRHVKTVHADFKDDKTIDGRENSERYMKTKLAIKLMTMKQK